MITSLRINTGKTHVPRPYLNKWARWLAQLQEITQARAIWLLRGQDGRLHTDFESGQATLEHRNYASELAKRLAVQAITTRATVEEHCQESDCCCVSVPLCWPDSSIYGALVLMAGCDGRGLLEWVRQLIEADFRTLHFVCAIDQHKNLLETRIAERTEDLRTLNERLAHELRMSQRTAQLLRQLVIHVPGSDEHGYFQTLVLQLVQMLDAEHAFVALLDAQNSSQANTISCYSANDWQENFSFTITSTPCVHVQRSRGVFSTSKLASDFPQAMTQLGLTAQAYLGVPLINETGRTIGVLAAMGGEDHSGSSLSE